MVADRGSLLIRWARLRDGRVCDITVESGRIAAITPNDPDQRDRKGGPARGPVIEASGRLVTESFINGHQHLDKVYTQSRVGDSALSAYTGGQMTASATGIKLARGVKADYDRAWITPNVRRALREAVRNGVLHIQAFVDVDTAAGLEGLYGVLAAREEFADVLSASWPSRRMDC